MVRAGFGIFYTRIPQIYQSAVINNNGLSDNFLSLDNTDFYQHQVFPMYPNAAVNCPRGPVPCAVPVAWQQYATSEVSAFAPDFRTPRVQQASLSLEREVADGFKGDNLLFVRARRGYDPGTGCESAAADLLQLSDLRLRRVIFFKISFITWPRLRPGRRAAALVARFRHVSAH